MNVWLLSLSAMLSSLSRSVANSSAPLRDDRVLDVVDRIEDGPIVAEGYLVVLESGLRFLLRSIAANAYGDGIGHAHLLSIDPFAGWPARNADRRIFDSGRVRFGAVRE